MLEYVERKMGKAMSTLGVNPFAIMMGEILEYIEERKKCSLPEVAGRFYKGGLTLEQLKSALTFLVIAKKIKVKGLEDPVYSAVGKDE